MKKLKQSQYYGIGLLVLMLVVFWAVFKVLAPTTFGSPEKLATYMKSALIYVCCQSSRKGSAKAMEQSYLMPGQERWESFRDANGLLSAC